MEATHSCQLSHRDCFVEVSRVLLRLAQVISGHSMLARSLARPFKSNFSRTHILGLRPFHKPRAPSATLGSGHQQYQQSTVAHNDTKQKKIAIVGGGLGGLMAACVLQKHGFSPKVFEREPSQQARGQGGVLDLHPESGQWAMEQAGLTDKFLAAARPEGQDTRVLDKGGTVLWEEVESTGMDRPEIDRPLLRKILLDSLHVDTVKWDHRLTDIQPLNKDSSGYMLRFSSSHSAAADIVIGADGARSAVRPMVTHAEPSYQGVTLIEVHISDVHRSHPEVDQLVGQGTLFALADNKGFIAQRQGNGSVRLYIVFRVKEGGLANLGISFDHAADTRTSILGNFKGWAPELLNLVHTCDSTFRAWPFYALPTGLAWQTQKAITLLGDAAHVMAPSGEGANLALQDGAELALALVRHSQAAAAIAEYETSMLARAERAARDSADLNRLMVSPDGSEQLACFFQQSLQ